MDMDDSRAVALRYDQTLPAPFVVASGRRERARRLMALARAYGVPVANDRELSARLVALDVGDVIPEELYQPVAAILSWILDMRPPSATTEEPRPT